VLAHIFLKFLGLPFSWETSDVDVSIVALLESLLSGYEMLCFKIRTVENFRCFCSNSIDGLLRLFGTAELYKSISFALFLALFRLEADLYALHLTELGKILLKLGWDH